MKKGKGLVMMWLTLSLGLVLVALPLLSGCAAPPPAAPPPAEKPGTVPPPAAPPPAEEPEPKTRLEVLIEGAKKEGQVEFWTSHASALKLLKPFEEKYPFLEVKIWDVSSGEALTRALTEAQLGKVSYDVNEGSGNISSLYLEKGLLAEYETPNVQGWPNQPPHKYWVNTLMSIKIPAYNTNLIPPELVPKSWEDLKDPRHKEWGVMASTSTDQSPLRMASMWGEGGELNWEKSFAYWREVFKNTEPRTARGLSKSIQLLAAGEDGLILLNSMNNALELKLKGAPVDIVRVSPVPASFKGLMIPKNAPHPNAAMLLVDYLTSTEIQIMFADMEKKAVVNPEAAETAVPNQFVKGLDLYPVPMEVYTEENFKKSEEFWLTLLGVL
jgi:ABC-type Fe3+ transport system substrate-binding protein